MNLSRITLTGADERTDLDGLVDLADRFTEVEIGLLYTVTPEGRPRYPSRDWLSRAASALSGRCAIHVCGMGARRELIAGDLADLTRHAPRVQVNGGLQVEEAEALASLVGTLMTQHNIANGSLLGVQARNHAILIDASGGRGTSPDSWVLPATEKQIGFAGGMGADNLFAEYTRISSLARPGSWSDMEGKLRIDDWFSLELAARCAEIHRHFARSMAF
ncbi:hypothetical protein [Paucibacter soli]|uniref:hypothetical protein n=1 Tax=Paucibacter soli TaxID=3133433 RepID=UPI0030AAC208